MIVYSSPKKCGKWSAQLARLRELWLNGESTMMVSPDMSLLKPAHLTQPAPDASPSGSQSDKL